MGPIVQLVITVFPAKAPLSSFLFRSKSPCVMLPGMWLTFLRASSLTSTRVLVHGEVLNILARHVSDLVEKLALCHVSKRGEHTLSPFRVSACFFFASCVTHD